MSEDTVAARLAADPATFTFDAAVRALLSLAGTAEPADAARFKSRADMAFAPGDVLSVDTGTAPPRVELGLLGLVGAPGVLPRRYTEAAGSGAGASLHALLDTVAHRVLAGLAGAGAKYRLERAIEGARHRGKDARAAHVEALLAVAGFAEPGVTEQLPCGPDALLHYAGLFVLRPRSAERLAALASDWLGHPVEVVEFAGAWLPIDPGQRTRLVPGRLGGTFNRLGRDAAAGVRTWDPQARIILRIGPLDRAAFEALLPNGAGLRRFVGLVRAYLGLEVAFGINLVLAAREVEGARLDARARPGGLLGWNTWLGKRNVTRGDADDNRFDDRNGTGPP